MSTAKAGYKASVLNKSEGRPLNGGVQPQNCKSGRVYVFGKNDTRLRMEDEEEDTVFEMVKVRPRKGNGKHTEDEKVKNEVQKVKIIHRPVFPNDSLPKFALQYGCTVAELKTTNNLYKEQDFHALKHIKIPIQPHSLLTERAEEERRRDNAFVHLDAHSRSHEHSQENDSDSDYEGMNQNQCVRTVSIGKNLKETEKFLKRMDDDIQKICQSVLNREPSSDDVTRKLTTQCIRPRHAVKKGNEDLGSCWGGFGWKSAIAVFIVVAIVLPLFYLLYIEKYKQ